MAEEEYVTLENYHKGVAAAQQQGITIGMLRALTDLHSEQPEIKKHLIALRNAMGDNTE